MSLIFYIPHEKDQLPHEAMKLGLAVPLLNRKTLTAVRSLVLCRLDISYSHLRRGKLS